jgi:hypothetical protein
MLVTFTARSVAASRRRAMMSGQRFSGALEPLPMV